MFKLSAALVLLAPLAAFAADPLVVNGVCPEDSGWPTAQQGAGRDIQVTLPRDRVCQPDKSAGGKLISVLGGTQQDPATSVSVTGGKVINKWGQGNRQTDKGSALLRFENVDGPILVEGVHLDARGGCEDLMNEHNRRNLCLGICRSYDRGAHCARFIIKGKG